MKRIIFIFFLSALIASFSIVISRPKISYAQNPPAVSDIKGKQEQKEAITKERIQSQIDRNEKRPLWQQDWFYPAIAMIVAVLISVGLQFGISAYRRKKHRRSLIIAFAYELVLAFHRCVVYYNQNVGRLGVSYSAVFEFSKESTLTDYCTVAEKPQVVAAIVYLKATYFQVARHIVEAAKHAAEANRFEPDTNDYNLLMKAAYKARGTGLVFFLAEYHKGLYEAIEEKTEMIIREAEATSHESGAKYLYRIFNAAKDVKRQLDDLRGRKLPYDQLKEKAKEFEKTLNDCLIPSVASQDIS